jgi:hypothetical protein
MPRGGARIGAGRPKGSVRTRRGDTVPFGPDVLPIDYLLNVMRDPTAEPARRDRAASALLPYIHSRQAEAYVGRKAQAERDARTAGRGTSWEPLLRQVETTPGTPRWSDFVEGADEEPEPPRRN